MFELSNLTFQQIIYISIFLGAFVIFGGLISFFFNISNLVFLLVRFWPIGLVVLLSGLYFLHPFLHDISLLNILSISSLFVLGTSLSFYRLHICKAKSLILAMLTNVFLVIYGIFKVLSHSKNLFAHFSLIEGVHYFFTKGLLQFVFSSLSLILVVISLKALLSKKPAIQEKNNLKIDEISKNESQTRSLYHSDLHSQKKIE